MCRFRVTLAQRLSKRGEFLSFGQRDEGGSVLFHAAHRAIRRSDALPAPAVMASAPSFGSALPVAFLIELMAEPARNRTLPSMPRFSASARLRPMLPWSSAAGADDHGRA